MKIVAIETSCDDTAIALLETSEDEQNPLFRVLSSAVSSQAALHAPYGGVFPSLAKREHSKNLPILLERIMRECNHPSIDMVAVTVGPGLEPALWTGITFAQKCAQQWNIPLIPVNHMEGHILSALVPDLTKAKPSEFQEFNLCSVVFPAIALLVSGGHTELVLVKAIGDYEIVGETRDDAAGECFDKIARMLELPYPGGPEISKYAESDRLQGTPAAIGTLHLPRPMLHSNDFNFSFSGLKTAALYLVRDLKKGHSDILKNVGMISAIARETEDAIVDVLVAKTMRALDHFGAQALLVGGGVSANAHLRNVLGEKCADNGYSLHISPLALTGDNAIMIAIAGYYQFIKNKKGYPVDTLSANGALRL